MVAATLTDQEVVNLLESINEHQGKILALVMEAADTLFYGKQTKPEPEPELTVLMAGRKATAKPRRPKRPLVDLRPVS